MPEGNAATLSERDGETLRRVARWIRGARHVVALTGAGISTESGIPDFRGPNGAWKEDPAAEKLATLHHYMNDPEVRAAAWKARLGHPGWSAAPNEGHRALAELERKGKLQTLVTQNIDGLHQMAGSSSDVVVEIHGTMREVVCMACDDRAPMRSALDRVRAGDPDPCCRGCGGILKSATISFGQSLVAADVLRAQQAAETCDLFLAIGTSLVVYPVAYLPQRALAAGARVVILNAQETHLDGRAHAVVRAPLGRSLPAVASLV
ncbi:NAD-dependent protein deacetylase [soil metagenome]